MDIFGICVFGFNIEPEALLEKNYQALINLTHDLVALVHAKKTNIDPN